MTARVIRSAALAALCLVSFARAAGAYQDCPANSNVDGYTCEEQTGKTKSGGHYRITWPSDWDGDLVIINHGFSLNSEDRRDHEVCAKNPLTPCETNTDCVASGDHCNEISYLGLDELLLPMGKAVAANTYSQDGWAVFGSAKDLKEMLKYIDKESGHGEGVKRIFVTGFSLGGAVTADAVLKLKINGAIPLCGAVGGGNPTWDAAVDLRLSYDFICDDVPGAAFVPPGSPTPDSGLQNTNDYSSDSINMALRVNNCFGNIFASSNVDEAAAQANRLDDFLTLTRFSGYSGPDAGTNVATIMGFATLGLGDFVLDDKRLKGKPIGLNVGLDYSTIGTNVDLGTAFDAGVKRLEKGKGRKKLSKVSYPDFTKGKGKKVAYPILSMAGAADWLVIPEFQRVFDTALADGGKSYTQTWITSFGHCVFTPEEVSAVFNEYFDWVGMTADATPGTQPTAVDVHTACLTIANDGIPCSSNVDCPAAAVDCNFDDTYEPPALFDRIPPREDWPPAATH